MTCAWGSGAGGLFPDVPGILPRAGVGTWEGQVKKGVSGRDLKPNPSVPSPGSAKGLGHVGRESGVAAAPTAALPPVLLGSVVFSTTPVLSVTRGTHASEQDSPVRPDRGSQEGASAPRGVSGGGGEMWPDGPLRPCLHTSSPALPLPLLTPAPGHTPVTQNSPGHEMPPQLLPLT